MEFYSGAMDENYVKLVKRSYQSFCISANFISMVKVLSDWDLPGSWEKSSDQSLYYLLLGERTQKKADIIAPWASGFKRKVIFRLARVWQKKRDTVIWICLYIKKDSLLVSNIKLPYLSINLLIVKLTP